MDKVEFLACGNFDQANASYAQRILQTVGQTGIPAINVANACATGSTAFREAYLSVGAGLYDITSLPSERADEPRTSSVRNGPRFGPTGLRF